VENKINDLATFRKIENRSLNELIKGYPTRPPLIKDKIGALLVDTNNSLIT
jgi:hypothetical protein